MNRITSPCSKTLHGWTCARRQAAPLQEALSLPTWPARSSFQNELLVPGMPLAAMPVESLYKAWSTQQGNAFGATRGLYLGDPARHLSQVYRELAIEVPAEFASMPDHLTLELELLALLLDAGNGEAARPAGCRPSRLALRVRRCVGRPRRHGGA